jgi:flagellar motor protein MotB
LAPSGYKKILAVFFIPEGETPQKKGEIVFQAENKSSQAIVHVRIDDPAMRGTAQPKLYKKIKTETLEKEAERIGENNGLLVRALREEIGHLRKELQLKDQIITHLQETVMQQSLQIAAMTGSTSERPIETLKPVFECLMNELTNEIEAGDVQLNWQGIDVVITVPGRFTFYSGKETPSQKGRKLLQKIGSYLNNHMSPIRCIVIKGHTDAVPIRNQDQNRIQTNWDLSALRATSIVRLFEEVGISSDRLLALGCSSHQPISDNTTLEGRTKNRRIEIIVSTLEKIR